MKNLQLWWDVNIAKIQIAGIVLGISIPIAILVHIIGGKKGWSDEKIESIVYLQAILVSVSTLVYVHLNK